MSNHVPSAFLKYQGHSKQQVVRSFTMFEHASTSIMFNLLNITSFATSFVSRRLDLNKLYGFSSSPPICDLCDHGSSCSTRTVWRARWTCFPTNCADHCCSTGSASPASPVSSWKRTVKPVRPRVDRPLRRDMLRCHSLPRL